MINFRKIKQDFAANLLSEGKRFFEEGGVHSAKILELSSQKMRACASVKGAYENKYECELEIDIIESEVIDSTCECSYSFDCQHLAALIFYLEKNIDQMTVDFSKNESFQKVEDADELEHLSRVIDKAKTNQEAIEGAKFDQERIEEYAHAWQVLTKSPFFRPKEKWIEEEAGLNIVLMRPLDSKERGQTQEMQLLLRLSFRSKPLIVTDIRAFLDAIKHEEIQELGGKRLLLTLSSFDSISRSMLEFILNFARFPSADDKPLRSFHMKKEDLGELFTLAYDIAMKEKPAFFHGEDSETAPKVLPCLYEESLEKPFGFFAGSAYLNFEIEFIQPPATNIILNPTIEVGQKRLQLVDIFLFDCARPGFIHDGVFYRFQPAIKRTHLRNFDEMQSMAIPEPLFGTFVENAMPELGRFAHISGQQSIQDFTTLPFVGELKGHCKIAYLDGEMDAELWFDYNGIKVPAVASNLKTQHMRAFVTDEGIMARNLAEEKKILDVLFQGFIFDPLSGKFLAKTEKKIVEFMTESLPAFQEIINFDCPRNLLEQFVYDNTQFKVSLKERPDQVCAFEVEVALEGDLEGVSMDLLWDCVASRKTFIEIGAKGKKKKKSGPSKILVLDLERLSAVIQIFDEIGISRFENHSTLRPLWNLTHLTQERFESLPVEFSITEKLTEIQSQMVGEAPFTSSPVPEEIRADLRSYQKEGVAWLERLRSMHLGGILADDMGLGKTLQAIVSVTMAHKEANGGQSLIICPTSLLYNWKEEFLRFNPGLNVQVIDGAPTRRHELIDSSAEVDVLVTSYTLLQKDIEHYQKRTFNYLILDEAQHIKNRGTRNAKSVKMLRGTHRLILTGTPIENSLEDLWSLFDFLMPGLLGSFERFVEKYIRQTEATENNLEHLKRKIFPFILRRMKQDVLNDLPPVSEIIYHCQLTDIQQELYRSYAESAKEELSKLVKKEGFDKIRIHVLATLTRLKQICCHPAIFAKDGAERGDSAKYEMLLDLLSNLAQNNRKAVIFSQYTRMLQIMRTDLEEMGVTLSYLDGSTKNRMEIVKEFNANPNITVFLISLKAGGVGLNLTGADTVIHYDMWWNPAVESQATDRVHRIGQKRNVSSYKLITLGTIEEKILEMQERKKGLVKQLVQSDEEAIGKLTWDEVLELLKT